MNEPKICPNCGTPTTEVRSRTLIKRGMSVLANQTLSRQYTKTKTYFSVCCQFSCMKKHIKNYEVAWIMIKGTLWGWIYNGQQETWRISELNKEKVQFI